MIERKACWCFRLGSRSMLLKAVEKAKSRLRTAQSQLERIESAESYDDFSDNWYLFLVAAKNVLTMLEQGSKDTPQCRQWFGGIKERRRSDPLLQYLFQARDDDEHGIADVTKLEPSQLLIGKAAPGYSNSISMSFTTDAYGRPTFHKLESHDGLPVLIEEHGEHAVLMPVTGRGGVTYQPPAEHLGQPLPDKMPVTVGKAAVSWLASVVDEAEQRIRI